MTERFSTCSSGWLVSPPRSALARLGSRTSRRPSPSRLKPRLTTKIAMPGTAGTHHWSRMFSRPTEIMAPHSGVGGCAPRPRNPRPAAVKMTPAMSRVARTIIEERQSGITCTNTMRAQPAPSSRATLMKSLSRSSDEILEQLPARAPRSVDPIIPTGVCEAEGPRLFFLAARQRRRPSGSAA